METIVKDKKTYKLHFIKTDKFKNVQIRVSFRNKIKKEEITIRNFLVSMLTFSTKKYKTKRELMLKSQDLYGVDISSKNTRLGNYMVSTFTLSTLEEKYTEKGNLDKCVQLLAEILFNPNVEKLKFDKESFSIIKENIETEIKSFKENTSAYSITRMFENMDIDAPFSYRMVGYYDDFKKITEENLYTYYKEFMRNNIIDIYVIGNFDTLEMENLISENFKFYHLNKEINPYLEKSKMPKKVNKIVEADDLSQSKLAIGCRYEDMDDFDLKYTLTLYNLILGVSTDSKLFTIVREKHSLAYYIYSRISKLDSILLIASGIESINFEKTLKLVKEQMDAMKKGEFSEEDMNKAVTFFIAALEQLEDNQYEILENYVSMQLLGIDDINTRKEKIKEVSKEDIKRIAKKVKIDTVYLLKGEKNNEEA